MAETSQNDGEFLSEGGIPSGLNRIKTQRVLSKDRLSSIPDELRSLGASRPPLNQKQKSFAERYGKTRGSSQEELRKGKKIAQWFKSYLFKDSGKAFTDVPKKDSKSELNILEKDGTTKPKLCKEGNRVSEKKYAPESISSSKVPKGFKSFSHELGPKVGVQQANPRAHSFNDLKELLQSLHSRFDAAKEVVNTELASFIMDVMDVLQKIESSPLEGKEMVEDLLNLAHKCAEMTASEFRAKCEIIVQDLTEKRQLCRTGVLKWLFTRLLFILTRCTRLLQFQKGSEPIDEKSLYKFKKCLESIPTVEMNWVPNPEIADPGLDYALKQKSDAKHQLWEQSNVCSLTDATWYNIKDPAHESDLTSHKNSTLFEQKLLFQESQIDFTSQLKDLHQDDRISLQKSVNNSKCGSLQDWEQNLDGSDSVICRICEEIVPTSHLESHSYICAYADKCDLNYLDVDERLSKLEDVLEQIIESRNSSFNTLSGSPESSKLQMSNSTIMSEVYSPKISEWRNKGVEGMFEDIHEMDTACIDDTHLTSLNMKGHLGIKLSNHGASSSTGSMTSVSSTNTPRAGHFDAFWLEHNNPSGLEDVQQMIDLADIARCAAGTDISKEGSYEFLLACMQDLQDLLQHRKLKALVIDTFGGRIEKLLQEKYILACELMDTKSQKSDSKLKESCRFVLDSASQSSAMSTPLHPSHKERTSIDDFEIIKPISRGAFGKVYLARKRTTGDLFAIKVLKKLDMIRKNDIDRILAERNILITVRNPFVVRFFYSFTCRDNLYLVMEYLNGGDLYSLLRKVGCLEEDVARTYTAELVLALEYLHSLGIVHRDLKPDNILIAYDGHIKLTDFGLSKIGLINSTTDLSGPGMNEMASSDAHNTLAQQTEDKSLPSAVGTPDYLAPEILLGTQHGYAADWWSVGIILFELLTGIPPFTAKSPEIIFDNILNRKIPWPSIPNDMSYEAQDLIGRFLIYNPNQRLGANGLAEVKMHSFFKGVNWDTLALQKAAFVPQPESADDTSYFVSRFSQTSGGMPHDQNCSDSDAGTCNSYSNSQVEMDECGDLAEFDSSPFDLSSINFSFKNLSQLASINHDVLLQTGKDSMKCSPSKVPDS